MRGKEENRCQTAAAIRQRHTCDPSGCWRAGGRCESGRAAGRTVRGGAACPPAQLGTGVWMGCGGRPSAAHPAAGPPTGSEPPTRPRSTSAIFFLTLSTRPIRTYGANERSWRRSWMVALGDCCHGSGGAVVWILTRAVILGSGRCTNNITDCVVDHAVWLLPRCPGCN